MNNLLNAIKNATLGSPVISSIFVTSGDRLLIGPYKELRAFATQSRNDQLYQALLAESGARFGRRKDDFAPTGEITQRSFRSTINNWTPNLADQRITRQFEANSFNPVMEYFSTITLEAHHIVEKDLLGRLGKNKGDLDNDVAPCVLIKGELHKRLYTSQGANFRNNNEITIDNLENFYLKNSETKYAYRDLCTIAEIILNSVK